MERRGREKEIDYGKGEEMTEDEKTGEKKQKRDLKRGVNEEKRRRKETKWVESRGGGSRGSEMMGGEELPCVGLK